MDLDNLLEQHLIAVPKKEQAMAWLIERGPLVVEPPLPSWILENLVADRRIMRLRRGAYLVPEVSWGLPSLPRTMNLLDPDGYVSGHGALTAQGLNDQDIARWWAVGSRRQADISYGLYAAHFVFSPESAISGQRYDVMYEGDHTSMATPTQAFIDEARLMPFGFDWVETGRVLRNAVEVGATDERQIQQALSTQPSLAATRRLGLLLEIVRGTPDTDLLDVARRNLTLSRITGEQEIDSTWRITLPVNKEQIRRGMK